MNSGSLIAIIGIALLAVCSTRAQLPSRLQIPGAIPLGAFPVPAEPHFRQERVLPAQPSLHRVRRPQQQQLKSLPTIPVALPNYPQSAPAAASFAVEDARPVNEDREDEYQQPSFVPPNFQQLVQQQEQHLTETVQRQQPQQQQQQQQAQQQQEQLPIAGGRFAFAQERQAAQQHAQAQALQHAQPQQQQQQPIRRPAFREASPVQQQPQQLQQQAPVRRVQQQQQHHQSDSQRPRNSQEHQQQVQEREQKPVAQILRKYREENEDGSITWGFENDDGSYKEEFIGVDCVTRGRYGYVDPDGMKREYTYETGIACDPNKKNSEEDDIADGYIDYQNQEMVLANGDRIDLGNIGKHKGRKPQQQQISGGYRN